MRIRKRAVPLPLSLLSPVPFSDLHLVQQQNHPQPSDHPPIRLYSPLRSAKLKPCEDEQEQGEVQESSLTRQSDSSAVVDNGRWCHGDKAIPLKKRKASFEMTGIVVTGGSKNKMKSKTNKKCPLATTSEDDANEDDDYEDDDDSDSKNKKSKGAMKKKKKKKKKKKGGSIMEGSRCSRVNGRGWRCMQPTLVGYSLCEHHLGKGRLRSMSAVRARSSSAKSCSVEETVSDDDEKKPKRMRIGMVKARSLSSLLCQPNTAVVHQIK